MREGRRGRELRIGHGEEDDDEEEEGEARYVSLAGWKVRLPS